MQPVDQPAFPTELQIQIEQALVNGKLPVGGVFSTKELATIFSAESRALERVMQAQVRKGLAIRIGDAYQILGIQGKSLDSLFQHTARAGMKPTSQVRSAIIEPASEIVAAKLGLPVRAPVYRLERTRIINDEVLANQVNYIPYEVSPGLEDDDMSRYSFQKLLEERYHTVITDIQEDMRLVSGSPKDLEVLGLPDGAQVLVVERLSFSCNRIPVVWASIHIRTDRYHYVAALWPKAAELLPEHGKENPSSSP
jgi:GntR family transcriptional regulator